MSTTSALLNELSGTEIDADASCTDLGDLPGRLPSAAGIPPELLILIFDGRLVGLSTSIGRSAVERGEAKRAQVSGERWAWPGIWEALSVFFAAYASLAMDQRMAFVAAHSQGAALVASDYCVSLDWERIRQHMMNVFTESSCGTQGQPHLASGLCQALCYANFVRSSERKVQVRILMLECSNSASDLSHQGSALLSCAFGAQSEGVTIDCLSVGRGASTVLQQAVSIAGGKHRVMTTQSLGEHDFGSSLLQTLFFYFLPGADARTELNATPEVENFAAVCVCHGKVCEIAYVCSCCLLVYCTENVAICSGCSTRFRPDRRGLQRTVAEVKELELEGL